ncbi:MAG: hypothetical protein EHM47_03600 [Ignavibacteriales bacterium]|nr:MAG: hypothetical protein EHM47_03600 [Ignavibacteriales bacterium]
MKTSILLFALSVTLILTSCSQLEEESSPVTPSMNKYAEGSDINVFPYEYLATFQEVEYVKWEESLSDDQWVIVTMSKQKKEFHHIFCEIVYTDRNEPVAKDRELFFAGNPDNLKFAVPKPLDKTISEVNLYAVYNYPTANELPGYNEFPNFPYNDRQKFPSIGVDSWMTKEKIISVDAAEDVYNNEHVFVQIDSKEGKMLVFMAKPSFEIFEIPKYGDLGINEVNIYGLSTFRSYDVE